GWLEDRCMIGLNPLRSVKPLRVVRNDSQRAFTLDELCKLVGSVPQYRACLYTVAVYTGLRRAELKSLEWNRINLDGENSSIELSPAKTKNRKGGTLPLHRDAWEALETLRAMAPEGVKLVFFRGVTQMKRFRKDLDQAGIAALDS